jgi:hypothetical protein
MTVGSAVKTCTMKVGLRVCPPILMGLIHGPYISEPRVRIPSFWILGNSALKTEAESFLLTDSVGK